MKDALNHIITSIVEHDDQVTIDESETDGFVTFTIHAAKEDIGKIIGKEGKIIRSIRNVMKMSAIKTGKKINISIAEAA